MMTCWVVTGNFTQQGSKIALFHDYVRAVDFVCEAARERWDGEEWYSDSAVRQSMIHDEPYGDSAATYTIELMEVN